ncbi:hypothetical protein STIAU_1021 [Stigmatella aurantiaca DW4/3-1]|uniref:Uncharacterized protein n=2 Tax=Stigmatella aurantiaca (strain DW4/3-1) TaxID=378806 RepID=Q092Y3_STIAD|nr:hypothetical protein STIAU_1021 [Stigmatella aurantiaca DW4/3-1]
MSAGGRVGGTTLPLSTQGRGGWLGKRVFLEFSLKSWAADSQNLARLALVPLGHGHGALDEHAFGFFQSGNLAGVIHGRGREEGAGGGLGPSRLRQQGGGLEGGQVPAQQHLAGGEHHGPGEDVLQLAHVAAPGQPGQVLQHLWRDPEHALVHLLVDALQQVVHQQGDVLAPLPQRGDLEGDDLEALVKVLAEAARGHLLREGAVGGGDDARTQLDALDAAHALELALLEHAQELGLEHQRHVADLVQEDGAVLGQLELALLGAGGAGERALLVAEQLALQQRVHDGRAVDADEGLGLVIGVVVDDTGEQLLARAALPVDEHRGVAAGDLADLLHQLLHQRAGADDVAQARRRVLHIHRRGPPRQLPVLQRPLHHQIQGGGIREGLVDVVERPGLHGPDRRLHVVVRGDEDDARVPTQRLHLLDDFQAAAVRQHHVQDDHAGHGLLGRLQPHGGAGGRHHVITRRVILKDLLEVHLEVLQEAHVVIDDEKGLHATHSHGEGECKHHSGLGTSLGGHGTPLVEHDTPEGGKGEPRAVRQPRAEGLEQGGALLRGQGRHGILQQKLGLAGGAGAQVHLDLRALGLAHGNVEQQLSKHGPQPQGVHPGPGQLGVLFDVQLDAALGELRGHHGLGLLEDGAQGVGVQVGHAVAAVLGQHPEHPLHGADLPVGDRQAALVPVRQARVPLECLHRHLHGAERVADFMAERGREARNLDGRGPDEQGVQVQDGGGGRPLAQAEHQPQRGGLPGSELGGEELHGVAVLLGQGVQVPGPLRRDAERHVQGGIHQLRRGAPEDGGAVPVDNGHPQARGPGELHGLQEQSVHRSVRDLNDLGSRLSPAWSLWRHVTSCFVLPAAPARLPDSEGRRAFSASARYRSYMPFGGILPMTDRPVGMSPLVSAHPRSTRGCCPPFHSTPQESPMKAMTRKQFRKARGQGMTEYIIIVALIAIAAIGVITLFGDNVRKLFGASASALAGNDNYEVQTQETTDALHNKNIKNFAQENSY